jgi:hypothetical protein
MSGGRARASAPRDHAVDSDQWPRSEMVGEPAAAVVQDIAARLAAALGDRPELSLRKFAATSDVGRQTIGDLLAGSSWPDVLTICRLERALGIALWVRKDSINSGQD